MILNSNTPFLTLLLMLWNVLGQEELNKNNFTDSFKFGLGSSAYQIEGASNDQGKAPSIWDYFTHDSPTRTANESNGDIAADSYYKYKQDLEIVKALGVKYYQFSISWPRILPDHSTGKINKPGVRYYNRILNLLKQNGIEAVVVLYHWDLPRSLQEVGGWTNSSVIDEFENYATTAFDLFGDRVSTWITFYDPYRVCEEGYGQTKKAPGYNQSGIANYLCGHNVLKAHAKVWHLYDDKYREKHVGKIGIVINAPWIKANSSALKDKEAAERALQYYVGWFANPIFSSEGDYPSVMKRTIAYRSALEGFDVSRLPPFGQDEIDFIKGTSDFFGVIHDETLKVSEGVIIPITTPSFENDMNVTQFYDDMWPTTPLGSYSIVPWGMLSILTYIKDQYDNPEVYITGSGYPDSGTLNDTGRITYFQQYLSSVLDAIGNGVSVTCYTFWSLLDGFEWENGYNFKYGIVHVDFNNTNRTRTLKSSAKFVKYVTKKRNIEYGPNVEADIVITPEELEGPEDDEDDVEDTQNNYIVGVSTKTENVTTTEFLFPIIAKIN